MCPIWPTCCVISGQAIGSRLRNRAARDPLRPCVSKTHHSTFTISLANVRMTSSVRPPSLPPTSASTLLTLTRVHLLHPGYSVYDNILLSLPAVDGTQEELGLHHRTLLTAGAIIADNAFDRAYLTHDRAGRDRVETTVPLDGLLRPGQYWLQLRGYEPFRADAEGQHEHDGGNSMPPPAPRPALPTPSTQNLQSQTPVPDAHVRAPTTPSSQPHNPIEQRIYPVVPSFRDWQFPHDRLPQEWRQRHPAPPTPSALDTDQPSNKTSRRCYITGYQMGVNECHLVPNNQDAWWANNGMRLYTKLITGNITDEANLAILRADIHSLLDNHQIGIVPKPLLSLPLPSSSVSPVLNHGPGPSLYAFAAHVLKDDDESREFCDLYHNVTIPQIGVERLRPEFLFTRFAWAMLSHLQTFLSSPTPRHVVLTVRNDTEPGSCETDLRWMNGKELTSHLATQGFTRSGSRTRKRSSSQMTHDEGDSNADAYMERWARRCRTIDSAGSSSEILDPETEQIRDNTIWYDTVGRFSRARDLDQERIEENTRRYEKHRQALLLDGMEDESDSCSELEHGYPPGQQPIQLAPSPVSDGVPTLSRLFNTSGSNRSSTLLDPFVDGEDRAEQAMSRWH